MSGGPHHHHDHESSYAAFRALDNFGVDAPLARCLTWDHAAVLNTRIATNRALCVLVCVLVLACIGIT